MMRVSGFRVFWVVRVLGVDNTGLQNSSIQPQCTAGFRVEGLGSTIQVPDPSTD